MNEKALQQILQKLYPSRPLPQIRSQILSGGSNEPFKSGCLGVRSQALGGEVVCFALDSIPEDELPKNCVVYLFPSEVRYLIGSSSQDLPLIHKAKKIFRGQIIRRKYKTDFQNN